MKEGWFDPEETGARKMFVILKDKKVETVAEKYLQDYAASNQGEVVYKTMAS